jgi:hypothetical protein
MHFQLDFLFFGLPQGETYAEIKSENVVQNSRNDEIEMKN